MGKTMNESNLMQRPFDDLTTSEKAAVLKSRFEKEASMPGAQRIKTREAIGEEYGLSGSSVGRLLNLIALCKSCHSHIHAKRGDYWGQRAPAKPASWEEDEQ